MFHSTMVRRRAGLFALTIGCAVFTAGIAGCGSDSVGTSNTTVPKLTPQVACTGVSGNLDQAQSALINGLAPALAALPQGGNAASSLVQSLNAVLDVVDALTGGLQDLATTRDPNSFTPALNQTDASLQCSLASLAQALTQLTQQIPANQLPGLGPLVTQLQAVFSRLQAGIQGNGKVDLTPITNGLVALSQQLAQVAQQARSADPVAAGPFAAVALALQDAFNDTAATLDSLGKLDGNGISANLLKTVEDVSSVLTLELAIQLGIPVTAILPVADAFGQVIPVLQAALNTLFNPVTGLLSGILNALLGGLFGGG